MPYMVSLHQKNYMFMIMNSSSAHGGINLYINSVCFENSERSIRVLQEAAFVGEC